MNAKKLIILAILLGLSLGRIAAQVNTYLAGDGITTVTKGSPVTGTLPSNLNANDSLYYEVSSRGGGGNLSVLAGFPKPMQGASQGRWGATFVNPTDLAVTVTQVDIIADTSLFGGVSGVVPATGWSLIGNDTVRWSGSLSVPAHEAYDFMADIAGNNLNVTGRQIRFRVATSAGTFENLQSQNQADADPYANLYYVDGGNALFVSPLILSGASNSFTVRLVESSAINALPSGTTLTIEIPAGWQNVLAGAQTGFSAPTVSGNSATGWTITAATTADLQGNNLDFAFSAVAPMVGTNSVYTFNTYLSIGAKCEFAVRVSQPVGGTGQGGILSIAALSGIPKPMDTGSWGTWGASIVNPTADDITVTQLDILAGGGTLLFKGATGTSPATGWTRPSASNVRWSGSLVVPAYSVYDFISQIRANRKNAPNNAVTIRFTTSAGIYEDAEHTTTQYSSNFYYANLYYLEAGSPCYALDGVMYASPK
ncbi:MAG: hypothetical protein QME74_05295, partial [Candidatus Edwardsbacteria bacterium]|nr:hypothetical protein [Candidatus Edwardsbacteria bacterium]